MDIHIERKIITGMIVSSEFLNNISASYRSEYMTSKASKNIAKWCISYYEKYDKAPKAEIEDFIESLKIKDLPIEETEDYIQLLDSLSKDYNEKDYNVQYLTDQAFNYFGVQSAKLVSDELQTAIKRNDLPKIKEVIDKANIIEKPEVEGVDPLSKEAIIQAFSSANDSIISYADDMGDFLSDELYKEAMVVILAPAKTGKSALMIELASQGLLQGNKVAFFQAGDLTTPQFNQRFYSYLFKRNAREKYCKAHYSPVPDCKKNQLGTCPFSERESSLALFEGEDEKLYNAKTREDYEEALKNNPEYSPCTFCHRNMNRKFSGNYQGVPCYVKVREKKPLTRNDVESLVNTKFKSLLSKFKLSTHASETLRPKDISNQLDKWEKEGFVPDIVVVDYIDILAPDYNIKGDPRNTRNNINIGLRRLSQQKKVCLITATQADSEAMEKETLTKRNFNEDRRILDHLTCMIAINQTPREKNLRMCRLSKILSRNEDFDTNKQLVCLQNLNIGRFVMKSFYKTKEVVK